MSELTPSPGVEESFSLKSNQRDALLNLISLNRRQGDPTQRKPNEIWKVLIFDRHCSKILAPVVRVPELREHCVTLYLNVDAKREAITDATAVYFVQPTKENLQRIIEDVKGKLYAGFHLNFCPPIAKEQLQLLAAECLKADVVSLINGIHDQYLDYQALEENLFHLQMPESYLGFNSSSLTETQADRNLRLAVDGLFSVLATTGIVPIIRCPANGAAEMVARALADRLSEHIRGHGGGDALNERFAAAMNTSSHRRPVLFVEERTRDIATQLHHPCTYRALVHDLLGLRGNSVRVLTRDEEESGVTRDREHTYDLDSLHDEFWSQNADKPFPQVAVEVNRQLGEYRAAKARVQHMQQAGGSVLDADPAGGIESRTRDLSSLVETLPALQAQKRLLDKHTNIATSLLSCINDRSLDRFFQVEESLLLQQSGKSESVRPEHVQAALELLSESGVGSPLDKLRLLVLLCARCDLSGEQLSKARDAVLACGVETAVADRLLTHTRSLQRFSTGAPGSIGLDGKSGASSAGSLAHSSSSSGKLLSHTYSSLRDVFSASVNYFKPAAHKNLWLARTLEALVLASDPLGVGRNLTAEQRTIADRYILLDPKLPPGSSVSSRTLTPIKKLITFMVGGGNYVEFENVQDLAKRLDVDILYGTTEISTSEDFTQQLQNL
mmetsp:Transcript_10588/g.26693  ORF Transcript_10588/g.26693 Transcript_10588/m.26693 type:complete len:670 (-) Transcript_10588:4195-6204(-)